MVSEKTRYWTILSAAGAGTRLGSALPKQYMMIGDKPVIEYALAPLLKHPLIEKVIVVLPADDQHWSQLTVAKHPKILTTIGGKERCQSVWNGLQLLQQHAASDDWVLIHDAARPCLRHSDIDKLMTTVAEHSVGGLLAIPVRDTVKRSDNTAMIIETVSRANLWLAMTPQMFRFQLLNNALTDAIAKQVFVTDDAAAIELFGEKPLLVAGRSDNIKITYPGDLKLAEYYLLS